MKKVKFITEDGEVLNIVFMANDGIFFKTPEDAKKHDNDLFRVKYSQALFSETAKENLLIYLANKSKLKANLMQYAEFYINDSWKEFMESLPKNKYGFTDMNERAKFDKALAYFLNATNMYMARKGKLDEAKKMIPKINNYFKTGKVEDGDRAEILKRATKTV